MLALSPFMFALGLLVGICPHSPPPQICNESVWPAHDALICGPGAHLFSCEHDVAPINRPASITGIAIDAMPARLTLPCVTELPPIAVVGPPHPRKTPSRAGVLPTDLL